MGPGAFISLPESISNWVELRDLQLYRCGFEKVPENISALSKLDTLLMEGFRWGVNMLHATKDRSVIYSSCSGQS